MQIALIIIPADFLILLDALKGIAGTGKHFPAPVMHFYCCRIKAFPVCHCLLNFCRIVSPQYVFRDRSPVREKSRCRLEHHPALYTILIGRDGLRIFELIFQLGICDLQVLFQGTRNIRVRTHIFIRHIRTDDKKIDKTRPFPRTLVDKKYIQIIVVVRIIHYNDPLDLLTVHMTGCGK